jgi:hypothetical protein
MTSVTLCPAGIDFLSHGSASGDMGWMEPLIIPSSQTGFLLMGI